MKQPIPGLAEHVTRAASQAHENAQKLRDARDRRRVIAIAAMRDAAAIEQDRIDAARAAHNETGDTDK